MPTAVVGLYAARRSDRQGPFEDRLVINPESRWGTIRHAARDTIRWYVQVFIPPLALLVALAGILTYLLGLKLWRQTKLIHYLRVARRR